ncbi:transposase [Burkholderia sp. lig30]|jgi:transposase|uniref:transposase n=1 Tax=Burkholderia sp. lig30 TaxID=1192124 RepID=UPI0009F8B048
MERRKVSNALWAALEPSVPQFVPPPKGGRRRSVDERAALNGIPYMLHTGIPREHLAREQGVRGGICATGKRPAHRKRCTGHVNDAA